MAQPETIALPVAGIEEALLEAISVAPVVLTASTGSGKSTLVPGWFAGQKVLVVEPRRVACRTLAGWVAGLQSCELGEAVGYAVRDESRIGKQTRVVFATPGVVLRWIVAGRLREFDVVVLDEFHERTLELDLIFALVHKRFVGKQVVMSATLGAERIAAHMGGRHLHVAGRSFPVDIRYIPEKALLPDTRGLDERVDMAMKRAQGAIGDILLFLPGKYEIARMSARISATFSDFDVLPIHGGLTLSEQSRVFEPSQRRKVIVATNVAETSLTVPGVGVVIDSGLVKRTRYINDRGMLTLVPVARDSADQRAGRSGRTGPGVCFRLWSEEAVLEPITPPEMYRESLSPLILAAAVCEESVMDLPFLDPPKTYAVEAATDDLSALRAIDAQGAATERGRLLFDLPIDAHLGNFLVEAEETDCIDDAVDLVAALSVGRPMFNARRPEDPENDFRMAGCDITALIRAVREGDAKVHGLNGYSLSEARSHAKRIRRAWGITRPPHRGAPDRGKLIKAAIAADERAVHVVRKRRGGCFLSNGGTELALAKESAVDGMKAEAVVVMASMGVGVGLRRSRLYATCASPVSFRMLAELGLGSRRVCGAVREPSGTVVAKVERVLAGSVISAGEELPTGEAACESMAWLILEGRWMKETARRTRTRLREASLAALLKSKGLLPVELDLGDWNERPVPHFEEWLTQKLNALGVSSGEDASLLLSDDFEVPTLPASTRRWLSRRFATELRFGDSEYDVQYNMDRREVTLVRRKGTRKDPPSLALLPSFPGFKIKVKHHSKVVVLRCIQ